MLSFTKSRPRTPAGPQNRNFGTVDSNSYFEHCDHKNTIHEYTRCNRRNGPDFGRVFLRSNYTDITQNTYIQSSMVNGDIGQRILKH